VKPGETSVVRLELVRAAPVSRGPLDYLTVWASQPGWGRQGNLTVRRGGEFVYSPVKPQSGVYRFTAVRQTGDRLHWFFSHGGQRDYWFFELGRRRFDRVRVSGGRRTREARQERGVDRGEVFEVEIDVQPTVVSTRITREGVVVAEDRIELAGAEFHTARWGLWLDKGDQVGLASFTFEPR
jgi:hypothetical protein